MVTSQGRVFLVGAGPGDPELITVKGLRLMQTADVVVHDRLVTNDMLKLCGESVELIDVGKYPDHHRISQEQINQLLVDKARSGLNVVRLKGGDPFVFGRGMEEFQFCQNANIECEIVPGISSCIAGPASAGIPVTSRGMARSFAVITGQTDPALPEHQLDFAALARIDTVVFMMGRKNLPKLSQSLIAAGRDPSTPAACIQQATMSGQRCVQGDLGSIAKLADEHNLTSPLITVVGTVATLMNSDTLKANLNWQSNLTEQDVASNFLERPVTQSL